MSFNHTIDVFYVLMISITICIIVLIIEFIKSNLDRNNQALFVHKHNNWDKMHDYSQYSRRGNQGRKGINFKIM